MHVALPEPTSRAFTVIVVLAGGLALPVPPRRAGAGAGEGEGDEEEAEATAGASPAPNPVLAVAALLAAALPAAFPGTIAAWSAVNDNVANFTSAGGASFLVISSDVIVVAASSSPAAAASPSRAPAGLAAVDAGTALALGLGIGVGALVVAGLLAVAIIYHQRVIAPAAGKDTEMLAQAG